MVSSNTLKETLPDIFSLMEIMGSKEAWQEARARIPAWHPRMDGEGEGEGEGSGEGEGEGEGSGSGSGGSGSGEGSSEGSGSENDEDAVTMSKDEAARLRRIARESADKDKKLKQEKEAADRKKKQEEGRFQELVDEEKTKTTVAEERAEKAEADLATYKFRHKVNEIANASGFEDPSDAHLYLDEKDVVDATDKVLESELRKVLAKKPHLKSKRQATGGNGGEGSGGTGGLSLDDIRRMTPDQVNENWDKVQKVMQGN